jgi:oligopeptidase A
VNKRNCSASKVLPISHCSPRWLTPPRRCCFSRRTGGARQPYAGRDLAELKEFAEKQLGLADLQPWDVAYASEKLRVARYAFSDQEVKQYFPEQQVLGGMFRVVETLYGLSVAADEALRWHEDVRFFAIRNADGALVGQFYLDLYARASKRGGAWMDDDHPAAQSRRNPDTGCLSELRNFSAPVGGRPAMFTHDEVITQFHQFGHRLHQQLTRVDVLGVSGINGVEWDAVELPSQFMENFCWEWDVLKRLTAHVDTGEPLPRALYDKMLAAKNFQSGMQTVRQIEFAVRHAFAPRLRPAARRRR